MLVNYRLTLFNYTGSSTIYISQALDDSKLQYEVEEVSTILAINTGSSSLKFKIYSDTHPPRLVASGSVTAIGTENGSCTITPVEGQPFSYGDIVIKTASEAVIPVLEWIKQQNYTLSSIGHRIVHGGMKYSAPALIDDEMIGELKEIKSMAPSHMHASLSVINLMRQAFPAVPHIACFDTYFHQHMPFVAKYYALPKPLWEEGIIRYGFHGLSCEYIMSQLRQIDYSSESKKTIIAHLGSGCSMTAVKGNESIDTTMGFTPAGGMMMSTRAGDIDPGVFTYLLQNKGMTVGEVTKLFNKEAGLKAVSETSPDIKELLEHEHTDVHAKQAIHMFCYNAKKQIGALAAAMGGLDTLVFTGGIGENLHRIRTRICSDLEFLGIRLNDVLNRQSYAIISGSNSKVTTYVLKTNEEAVIAGHVRRYMDSHTDDLSKEYVKSDPGENGKWTTTGIT